MNKAFYVLRILKQLKNSKPYHLYAQVGPTGKVRAFGTTSFEEATKFDSFTDAIEAFAGKSVPWKVVEVKIELKMREL